MSSLGYLFGPPPPAPATFPSRSNRSDDVISTQIPVDLISKILNESIATGEVNFNQVELDLDSIIGSNTTVENLSTDTIDKNTDEKIRIIADSRFEGNILFGANGFAINPNYKVQILGDFLVTGTTISLNSGKINLKDNCIGIGIGNTNINNFINGYYFPKNDNFSGFGLAIDKVGLISVPYGTFGSSAQFDFKESDLKRFSDKRNSFRFVYINEDFDLDSEKTIENPFSISEMSYINSLNNIENQASNYYLNVEMNNLTCHGGNFISGISQDFNIILTKSTNVEDIYITCNLVDQSIDIFKNLNLTLTNHQISCNGSIDFSTQSTTSPINYFSLSNTGNKTYRNFYFNNIGSGNSNIIFGGDDVAAQNTFTIYYNSTANPVINIDSSTTSTDRVEISKRLVVEGPDSVNLPTLKLLNNVTGNKIGTIKPISSNYLQANTIDSTANTNFTLLDVLDTGYTDLLFNGYIVLSDTTNNKHLSMRLEGFYTTATSSLVITRTVISKKDIVIDSDNSISDILISASISGTTLLISVLNNLTSSMKGLLRMEIIQN